MSKKLKSLKQFNKEIFDSYERVHSNEPIPNGIACPECGHELYDYNPMTIMTTVPPQKYIKCINCSWEGSRLV